MPTEQLTVETELTNDQRIAMLSEVAAFHAQTLGWVTIGEKLATEEQSHINILMQIDVVFQLSTLYSKMLSRLVYLEFDGEQYRDVLEMYCDCVNLFPELTEAAKVLITNTESKWKH